MVVPSISTEGSIGNGRLGRVTSEQVVRVTALLPPPLFSFKHEGKFLGRVSIQSRLVHRHNPDMDG